jgi:hypothetical protein
VWEYGLRNILVAPCVDRVWRKGKLLLFLMMRKITTIPIVRETCENYMNVARYLPSSFVLNDGLGQG